MWSQPRSALVGSLKAQHVGNGSTVNAFSSRFSPTVNGPSSVPSSPQTRIGSQLFRCPLPRVHSFIFSFEERFGRITQKVWTEKRKM